MTNRQEKAVDQADVIAEALGHAAFWAVVSIVLTPRIYCYFYGHEWADECKWGVEHVCLYCGKGQ